MAIPGQAVRGRKRQHGFVLRELLAITCLVAVFGTLFHVWSQALVKKRDSIRCLTNGRLMMQAFALYAEDHSGLLAPNEDVVTRGHPWFAAFSGTTAQASEPNIAGDPKVNLFAPYVQDKRIWKCTVDRTVMIDGRRRIPTSRSVSMNSAVGTVCSTAPNGHLSAPTLRPHAGWLDGTYNHRRDTKFRTFGRLEEFVRPASTFVFIEEHPPSLNDGAFGTPGYDPQNPTLSNIRWVDFPALYHGSAAMLTFADGHADLRRWRNLRYPRMDSIPLAVVQPDQRADWEWIATHATQPIQ